jgi:hypothetical protein
MKNKNFRKLKYVSGNPQNAGFCTIYTSFWGLWRPTDLRSKLFSLASLAVLHLLFQNSLLLLKVLKALRQYCNLVFKPWSGQTKDYTIGICCLSTKHAALTNKSNDWLAQNLTNVSKLRDMSTR